MIACDLIRRLRDRAELEDPTSRGRHLNIPPEITWDELGDIASLLREAADALSDSVVAPQPETPAGFAMTVPTDDCACQPIANCEYRALDLRCPIHGPKPSAVVSVEALRALPRHRLEFITSRNSGIETHCESEFVKWSDLAALWPPPTGD